MFTLKTVFVACDLVFIAFGVWDGGWIGGVIVAIMVFLLIKDLEL